MVLNGCGPSGDPYSPNPGDFKAALPCHINPAADATIVFEVIDREGRLVRADGVIIKRDAISIQGTQGQGGFAVHLDRPGELPDEITVSAPFCWNIVLRPEVTSAIVSVDASYPLVPGERLAVWVAKNGMPDPLDHDAYREHVAGGMLGFHGRVQLSPMITKRGS